MSNDEIQPFEVKVAGDQVAEKFWVMDVAGPVDYAAGVAAANPFDSLSVRQLEVANIQKPFGME